MITLFLPSFGLNAGAAINPARDLAPRILSIMGGWPEETFKVNNIFGLVEKYFSECKEV